MVVVAGGKEPRAKSKTGQRTTPSKPKDAGADASKIRKTSLGEGPEPHSSSSRGSAVGDGDEISGQQNVEAQVAHKLDTRGSVAGDQVMSACADFSQPKSAQGSSVDLCRILPQRVSRLQRGPRYGAPCSARRRPLAHP